MSSPSVDDRAPGGSWWRDYVADHRHGPLPALLLALTVATGLVDAVSVLSLGRVFVANMTGNIVFIGFALAGAAGFSLAASLIALAGFLTGAGLAGLVIQRLSGNRAVLLLGTVAAELVLVGSATLLAAGSGRTIGGTARDAIVALVAVALGLQNGTVRRLAVPDLTTSVLTMTLTGIAADLRTHNLRVALRRGLSVIAMLAGALAGALLILNVSVSAAMLAATGLIALVLLGAWLATRREADWQTGA